MYSRREFLKQAGAGAFAIASSGAAAAKDSRKRPPNIILIMADDLGIECIGAHGGTSYKTPRLDDLGKTGMRFDHCYSQPLCTPSRVKIMTGTSNIRNYISFGVLDPKATTFAHLLKRAGYATCVVGKWQLKGGLEGPKHFGFDEYALWQLTRGRAIDGSDSRFENPALESNGKELKFDNGEYGPDVVSDFACSFVAKNKDKPFLVYYPMILTHCPFTPTPDSEDWDPKSPGSKTYKGNAKYFGDMVTYMDKIVGKLVDKLEALGLRENTLILFTGDNGTDKPVVSEMGERKVVGAKGSMTDGGTHVPCIANFPGVVPGGKVSNDLVDFSDMLPTICEAAGVPVPNEPGIDGRSFWPQLQGEKGNPRDAIHVWYSRTGGSGRAFARNQCFKLYRDGRFFDVPADPMEQSPLADDTLDRTAMAARDMLTTILDRYEDARPEALRRTAPTKKRKK